MKKRKKLIKRIGAVLCALVVAVSSMGVSGVYYGAEDMYENCHEQLHSLVSDSITSLPEGAVLPSSVNGYEYCLVTYRNYYYYVIYSDSPIEPYMLIKEYSYGWAFNYNWWLGECFNEREVYRCHNSSINWSTTYCWESYTEDNQIYYLGGEFYYDSDSFTLHPGDSLILYTNYTIYCPCGRIAVPLGELYNSSLGYLQNVRMNTVFDDVPLGENVGETYTTRWYYDQFSTTGIDLTSGDYFIRYYQERWIVKGYGDDDLVEKSDRYILGDFIVQNGYIETYSVDVESTLHGQGYEEPSFTDLLWNKFVTTHYYFQIFDAKNNEVGGLLHIYLTDDNGKFGVEHISETLDNEGNYDDSGYKDFIDEDKITSDDVESGFNELEQDNEQTLEEWFEDFSDTPIGDIDKLEGSEAFSTIFRSYVLQVASVSSAVGAIFALLPAWVLGLLGISFVLLFILILLNES